MVNNESSLPSFRERALAFVRRRSEIKPSEAGDLALELAELLADVRIEERAKALEHAASLLRQPRMREWSVGECALAVRTLDHPPECSCHRWVECGRPA